MTVLTLLQEAATSVRQHAEAESTQLLSKPHPEEEPAPSAPQLLSGKTEVEAQQSAAAGVWALKLTANPAGVQSLKVSILAGFVRI